MTQTPTLQPMDGESPPLMAEGQGDLGLPDELGEGGARLGEGGAKSPDEQPSSIRSEGMNFWMFISVSCVLAELIS